LWFAPLTQSNLSRYVSADSFIQAKPPSTTRERIIINYLPSQSTAGSIKQTMAKLNQYGNWPIVLAGNNRQSDLLKLCCQDETDSYLIIPCRSTFLLNTLKSRVRTNIECPDFSIPNVDIHRNLRSRTFLVADDNEINRTLLKSQLLQSKAVVLEAKNGKESLELLNSVAFDLIFLDLQMPVINGMDIVRYLKTNENVNAQTPVIAVTAHALPEQLHTVLEAGFSDCLIKPLLQSTLDVTLKKWIPDPSINAENWNSETNSLIQRVLRKTSGDKGLAASLMSKLFEEMPDQLVSIERGIVASNAELAKQTTHKLNGSASFCEAKSIQKYAAKLENELDQDTNNYSIDKVRGAFEDLKQAIEDLIQDKESIMEAIEGTTLSYDNDP